MKGRVESYVGLSGSSALRDATEVERERERRNLEVVMANQNKDKDAFTGRCAGLSLARALNDYLIGQIANARAEDTYAPTSRVSQSPLRLTSIVHC